MRTTEVWWVRHCQSDHSVRDELTRPLTAGGTADAQSLGQSLADKGIGAVFSSPYRRALESVGPLARALGLEVAARPGLRERETSGWFDSFQDFLAFTDRQWADPGLALPGGESLDQVRVRYAAEVQGLVAGPHRCVAVGTHGTALAAHLSTLDPRFDRNLYRARLDTMPWVVRVVYNADGRAAVVEDLGRFLLPSLGPGPRPNG